MKKKLFFTYLFDRAYRGFRKGDLKKIDVVNYAFGLIEDGKLSLKLLEHRDEIIKEAHSAGVKVVLSIGGWGAGGFSEMASSKETREEFIDSIIFNVKANHFDGVDIDWEYPTSSAGNIASSPDDKDNFTLFMEELRVALDNVNPNLILSIAVSASPHAAKHYYDIPRLNKVLDYLHLMTYDLIDYKTLNTTHHTNLYPSKYSNLSVDEAVKAYINEGMDPQKIIVGLAFFGHLFTTTSEGTNGIGATSENRRGIPYRTIVNDYLNKREYKVYLDEDAKAPWIYGNNTFISYDDPDSIKAKCEYVLKHNLGGVMNWEYNQDTENSDLINAIKLN
ncbi:MAG TPA: glycoside hydrolase family 18 protein [Acholeplasmataceae bacterium]|nr:glycoside hydrolase family 18 protein [Acholeplasmataceae bacterium]